MNTGSESYHDAMINAKSFHNENATGGSFCSQIFLGIEKST
jgi:hypothetical protein